MGTTLSKLPSPRQDTSSSPPTTAASDSLDSWGADVVEMHLVPAPSTPSVAQPLPLRPPMPEAQAEVKYRRAEKRLPEASLLSSKEAQPLSPSFVAPPDRSPLIAELASICFERRRARQQLSVLGSTERQARSPSAPPQLRQENLEPVGLPTPRPSSR